MSQSHKLLPDGSPEGIWNSQYIRELHGDLYLPATKQVDGKTVRALLEVVQHGFDLNTRLKSGSFAHVGRVGDTAIRGSRRSSCGQFRDATTVEREGYSKMQASVAIHEGLKRIQTQDSPVDVAPQQYAWFIGRDPEEDLGRMYPIASAAKWYEGEEPSYEEWNSQGLKGLTGKYDEAVRACGMEPADFNYGHAEHNMILSGNLRVKLDVEASQDAVYRKVYAQS